MKTSDGERERIVRLSSDQLLNLPASAFEKQEKRPRKMPNRKPKKRICDIDPPGPGPWSVFMLVNVTADEDTKKQTEVRLDTYPELVKAIKNREDQGDWVIVMQIGAFYDFRIACLVLSEWSDSTRGPGPRIAQGLCIWERYKQYNVNLYLLGQSKKEVQEIYKKHRQEAAANEHVVFEALNLGGGARPGSVVVRDILKVTSGTGFAVAPPPPPPTAEYNIEMNGKRRKKNEK